MATVTIEVAEPTVTTAPDGDIYVQWPEDAPNVTLITRELFLALAGRWNQHRPPTTPPT